MTRAFKQPFVLGVVLLLAGTLARAVTISSVSDSMVTLTAGRLDGVQVGMTAMVYGVTTVEGKAAEVPIAKVQVTAVEDRSCTASILRALTTATGLEVSVGQRVQFQQAVVPLPSRRSAEGSRTKSQPTASPSKDPYAGLSPLELSEKADTAYKAERFDEAEKLYSAVLRAVPDDPLALQRLKELSARKRQAEAEAQRRAELAERLKNADFFLTRGDDAYKAGDFPVAASYYIKVAEVDESYRDAGGKYWLSKARAAKAKGDTAVLREAMGKLKGITVPESLKGDLASLGPKAGDVRTSSVDGLEYVYVPAGAFQMGCVPGDSNCESNEKPRRMVTISEGFWMARTEVTVRAFRNFVGAKLHSTDAERKGGWGFIYQGGKWVFQKGGVSWNSPGFSQNEDSPVVMMSWNDAKAYCDWVAGRLPTEAEWEYAGRGGREGSIYPWGDGISHENANYGKDSGGPLAEGRDRWEYTSPAASFAPNGFGLYDMAGNALEWCSDWYDGADSTGPASGGRKRVVRGGCWIDPPKNLRLSFHFGITPMTVSSGVGFRCVQDDAP